MKRLTPDAPAHWTRTRLRHVLRLNPSKSEIKDLEPAQEVSFLPMEAIGEDGSTRLDATRPLSEVQSGYSYFRDEDVVVAKITPCFENGKGALVRGLHGGIGFGTTELIVARPLRDRLDSEYLQWIFQSSEFRKLGEGFMYGAGGQKRVPDDFVRDYRIALPPLSEQRSITSFLHRETGKIDALVEEQRRLIVLLKEKRQAVISHAVTKGLDPNARMKPSGLEWLGDVPEHWVVTPIRSVARLESGHTPSRSRPEWWEDCTVPWFSLADIWQVRKEGRTVITETSEQVSEIGLANSSARVLPAGTVMLSRTASVGFAAIMGVDMATTQDFANWVCGPKLSNHFLLWTFRAMRPEFSRLMMGSTHNTIYMPDLAAFRMPLPPMEEQRELVAFLQSSTGQIDSLLRQAMAATELLSERRAALISAAVTGKIDVREAATEQENAA